MNIKSLELKTYNHTFNGLLCHDPLARCAALANQKIWLPNFLSLSSDFPSMFNHLTH